MSLRQDVLKALPATASEIAALTGSTVRVVNATLCHWKEMGKVRLTDRYGERIGRRGKLPRVWEKVDSTPG